MKYKWKSHGNAYGHKTGYTSDMDNWTITRIEGGVTLWKVSTKMTALEAVDYADDYKGFDRCWDNGFWFHVYKRTLKDAKRYCEEHIPIGIPSDHT